MIWSRGIFKDSAVQGPRGHRAYAVGDIHGRLDLLEELLALIESDDRARAPARTSIVFLGDLIDRGPDSANVIELLRTYQPEFGKPVFLAGNHEEVLLRILDGESDLLADWLKFGGAECSASYGIDPSELRSAKPADALDLLRSKVPDEHVEFLASFVDSVSFGRYLFVHAGIRPGVPLSNQTRQDLRWIRHPFLDDESDHGQVIVHGHTISEDVDERPNRIGIDTGAYSSGRLTALGIQGTDRWFLQTGGQSPSIMADDRVANVSEAY